MGVKKGQIIAKAWMHVGFPCGSYLGEDNTGAFKKRSTQRCLILSQS